MTPFKNGNRVTSPYGNRAYQNGGKTIKEFHRGQDIVPTAYTGQALPESAWEVREVTGGKVAKIAFDVSRGNYADIATAPGVTERYQHLQSVAVKVGQDIRQGGIIGVAGNTGKSTGRHLHFMVFQNGTNEKNAILPIKWSGIPNAIGLYSGNDTLDNQSEAPQTKLFKLSVGAISKGDRASFDALAKVLAIPCAIDTNGCAIGLCKYEIGPVSKGDMVQVEALADKLQVPHKILS